MDKRMQANQLVRECMTTALLQLMQEKAFEAITVSEITRQAGVSRTSYYRNYTSKEDILKQGLDRTMDAFIEKLDALPHEAGIQDAVRCAFVQARDASNFLTMIHRAGLDHLLRERFDSFTLTFNQRMPALRSGAYPARILSGALLNTLLYWFDSGMQESVDDLAKTFFSCMEGVLRTSSSGASRCRR